jgi:UDP-glucuronate 4-epimerase
LKIFITGVAGFIGMHVAKQLLDRGDHVYGIDNLNDYYDTNLKKARLALLSSQKEFRFELVDLQNQEQLSEIFQYENFDGVIHLAAQVGVRYSLKNPHAFIDANIKGFMNVLECCRYKDVSHLVYASSSSVYGANLRMPFSEAHNVDHPVSLYAATKKANELMAHTYSHLYGIRTTGLRFFTVYGPWGRPDMALFKFTDNILKGRCIDVFNNGRMVRDFTYIDDIVEGVIRIYDKPPSFDPDFDHYAASPATSDAPYRILNIGNGTPVSLLSYVNALENALGVEAKMNMMPMQAGDLQSTAADTTTIADWIDFRPKTEVKEGVKNFVDWYIDYYGVSEQKS